HCVEESLNHGERELLLLPRKPSIVFDFGKGNSESRHSFSHILHHPKSVTPPSSLQPVEDSEEAEPS
ncbi:hypothetical protein FA13DRAFT_1750332, partial [Coprinellus micaceus]